MQISPIGKLFLASIGLWLGGRSTRAKIRGTPDEIAALTNALASSWRFQDALNAGATPKDIIRNLGLKEFSADEWEQKTGIPWPL